MHLITGKIGADHITSANDGFRNAQIYGKENLVFNDGGSFPATKIDNNTVRIGAGQGYIQGRFFEMLADEDVNVLSGTDSFNRCDLIVARYEKNANTQLESIRLVVLAGERTTSGFVPPGYIEGDILAGDLIADFPLYQVEISGIEIQNIRPKFEIKDSIISQLSQEVDDLSDAVDDLSDAVANKVDKVTGKGLSTNDFTTAEKTKLSNLKEIKVGTFTGTTNQYGQAIFLGNASLYYMLGISAKQGYAHDYIPVINSAGQWICVVKDTMTGNVLTNTSVSFDYLYLIK